jgi:hypothetical protein
MTIIRVGTKHQASTTAAGSVVPTTWAEKRGNRKASGNMGTLVFSEKGGDCLHILFSQIGASESDTLASQLTLAFTVV